MKMSMNIKELNEKLEIILQETNTRTNAFEPAPPTTKEEYKVLKAISDYLLEKIKNKFGEQEEIKTEEIGTHSQGTFEIDFHKNDTFIATVGLLSENRVSILLTDELVEKRVRFVVHSLEEAKEKINEVI